MKTIDYEYWVVLTEILDKLVAVGVVPADKRRAALVELGDTWRSLCAKD